MFVEPYDKILVARIWGLDAKIISWVFITSLANSADETTMVETSPSLRCIRDPCCLAKSRSPRWGRERMSWCMFPIIGSFHGPGGRFEAEFLLLLFFPIFITIIIRSKKVDRTWKEGHCSSMSKTKVSLLGGAFCVCTWHFFYNF